MKENRQYQFTGTEVPFGDREAFGCYSPTGPAKPGAAVRIRSQTLLTFNVEGERRGGEHDQQRLAAEHEEKQAADRLAYDDFFHVCQHSNITRR